MGIPVVFSTKQKIVLYSVLLIVGLVLKVIDEYMHAFGGI